VVEHGWESGIFDPLGEAAWNASEPIGTAWSALEVDDLRQVSVLNGVPVEVVRSTAIDIK
jgi:hypothetical protein